MTGPGESDAERAAGQEQNRARDRAPAPEPGTSDEPDEEIGWRLFVRDVLSSVLAVALVGVYLFAVSGVWPPLVAVESPSMVPNMQVNDLVFVMEERRFAGEDAHHGVVTAHTGATNSYEKFGQPGDVIVFERNGRSDQTPIIHRAMFWVSAGENWYDEADSDFVGGAESCEALANCPAPHAGFITKGDGNSNYDQAGPGVLSGPVRPEWVVGTAELRIPGLGWIRLTSTS
jgi:signal peptidase